MDTADQWPQDQVAPPSDQYSSRAVGDQKKVKPQKDQAPLNCPRCQSTNTKFCYYNNYSLTQPRYFCKNCRRYWTAGGSLRNVPVGGGSRKNKRSSNSLVTKNTSDNHFSQFSFQNPNSYNKPHDQNQDLNLAFPTAATQDYNSLDASRFLQVPSKIDINKDNNINNIQLNLNSSYSSSHSSTSTSLSAMELLKINSTNFSSRGSHTFMPSAPTQNPNMIMYAQGFQFQDFSKPQAEMFAVDEHGSKYESRIHGNGNNQEHINGTADQRLMFPYGSTSSSKHIQTTNGSEQNKVDGMYWNGMSGGGSW